MRIVISFLIIATITFADSSLFASNPLNEQYEDCRLLKGVSLSGAYRGISRVPDISVDGFVSGFPKKLEVEEDQNLFKSIKVSLTLSDDGNPTTFSGGFHSGSGHELRLASTTGLIMMKINNNESKESVEKEILHKLGFDLAQRTFFTPFAEDNNIDFSISYQKDQAPNPPTDRTFLLTYDKQKERLSISGNHAFYFYDLKRMHDGHMFIEESDTLEIGPFKLTLTDGSIWSGKVDLIKNTLFKHSF